MRNCIKDLVHYFVMNILQSSVILYKNGSETIKIPDLTDRYMVPYKIEFSSKDIDNDYGDFEVTLILPNKKKTYGCSYFQSKKIIDMKELRAIYCSAGQIDLVIRNLHVKQNTITYMIQYEESYGDIIFQQGRILPESLERGTTQSIAGSGTVSKIEILSNCSFDSVEILPIFTHQNSEESDQIGHWMDQLNIECSKSENGMYISMLDFIKSDILHDSVYLKYLEHMVMRISGGNKDNQLIYVIAYGFPK